MELSEGIYQDLHHHPNDEEYANVGAKRPREVKGHHVWKWLILALVGLLCLLLLVITTLFAMTMAERNQCLKELHTSYNITAEEKDKIAGLFATTMAERNQCLKELHTSYNITAEEKDKIAGLFATTMAERNQCHSDFSSLQTEKAELHTSYNITAEEKDKIAGLFSTTMAERDQCQSEKGELYTSYNITAEEKDNLHARLCKLEKDVKQYAVDVTLDPETAHPSLIVSADGKQVKYSSTRSDLPANPKRFDTHLSVLGKKGFSSGRFYYEVQVKDKKDWLLGITRESSNRNGSITCRPENGYWILWQNNWNELWASDDTSIPLKPLNKLERVGVFVDYEAGLVSFYNADHWDLLYSFKHAQFNATIYPVFNPHNNEDGQNSSPLVIHTPVACQYHGNT